MSENAIEKLTAALIDFFIESDPYEFFDSCEDLDAATKILADDLENGKTELYIKALLEFIDEKAADIKKATALLNELAEL